MRECTKDRCVLYRAGDVFDGSLLPPLPEGADPKLCWQHQSDEVRELEIARRADKYRDWRASGEVEQTQAEVKERVGKLNPEDFGL